MAGNWTTVEPSVCYIKTGTLSFI